MSTLMDDEIKRWTARRKSALVLEIIQGKTTVVEASRAYDLPPLEIENWIEDGKKGMENALRANPQDVREQYEQQLKDLQEAYGEAMLELRARKNVWSAPKPQVRLSDERKPFCVNVSSLCVGTPIDGCVLALMEAARIAPHMRAPAHDGHDSGMMADSIPEA